MAMTDPIADMLTRIRNANVVYHEKVDIPASKVKRALAEIMKNEGYIRDYQLIKDDKQGVLRLYLKYGPQKVRVITGLRRISKPGLRIYVGKEDLPRVLGGLGVAVVSTTSGLMSDKQARAAGLGGEVLCYIW